MPARVPLILMLALLLGACETGRDALLASLESSRPHERADAVRKLADQGRPEDLVLFTRAAKDVSGLVREQAVIALGKSHDPRVVDLLGELLEDVDERVQQKAAKALAEIKNDRAKTYLMLQYARRGRSTRIAIVEALKAANVPGAMAGVIAAESKALWDSHLRAFTEGSLPERVGAAEQLGKSGRADAVNRLLPLIGDSQVVLVAAGVRGLGDAGDRRAIPPVARLLDETHPDIREAAILALQRLGDLTALSRLQAVALEKSSASSMATRAILALPQSAETDAALCAIVLGGNPPDSFDAGRAIRSRGQCPLEPIYEALRSREPLGALMALRALGETASDAAPRVALLLSSPDPKNRHAALAAIAELGAESVAPAVKKVHEAEVQALAAARADWIDQGFPLEHADGFGPGARDAVKPEAAKQARHDGLLAMVDSQRDARLREQGKVVPIRAVPEIVPDVAPEQLLPLAASLRALGQLKIEGAKELLAAFVDERSPILRNAALVGLAALGGEAIALAETGLFEPDRTVQADVARALANQGEEGMRVLVAALPKIAGSTLGVLEAFAERTPPPEVAPHLARLVTAGGPESVVAAHLLGRMKARDSLDALLATLEDPTSPARREVLRALGEIGDARAAEAIARDLCNDLPDIRAAAAEALAAVGSGAQMDSLDALKGDYYRHVREAAENALARLGKRGGTVKENP